MEKVYLNLFLIAGSVVCTLACSCESESLQEMFCNRDFGVSVHVVGDYLTPQDKVYEIRFDKLYYCKLPAGTPINKTMLITSLDTCGILLQNGTSYTVSGQYERRGQVHYLKSRLCDYLDSTEREVPACPGDM